MSTREFVDFQTLEEDVVYTVKTIQYLFGSAGYFYLITVDTPGKSAHYMTTHEGPWEKPIHYKLEGLRKLGSNKKFTFIKATLEAEKDFVRTFSAMPFIRLVSSCVPRSTSTPSPTKWTWSVSAGVTTDWTFSALPRPGTRMLMMSLFGVLGLRACKCWNGLALFDRVRRPMTSSIRIMPVWPRSRILPSGYRRSLPQSSRSLSSISSPG